jgi:chemotaxis protein MotA
MGKGTMIGVMCAMGAIFGSMIMEGANPASLLAPPALLLIIVGTFGVSCAGTSLDSAIGSLKNIGLLFANKEYDAVDLIGRLSSYADIARRDGVLALESQLADEDDELVKKGLQLLSDGVEIDEVRSLLAAQAMAEKRRLKQQADFWGKMGGYAPCLGIIGTVVGLIHTLEGVDQTDHRADDAELGHLIGAAFTATFFGVLFANVFFLPFGAKVTAIADELLEYQKLGIEGIVGIGSGMNPRLLVDQLGSHLSPDLREELADAGERKSA